MEKNKLKKIIYVLGISFLALIIILNLLFTANLDSSEHIEINFNYWLYIIGIIMMEIIIYFLAKAINRHLCSDTDDESNKKIRKRLFKGAFVIYILFNIIWAVVVNPKVVGDSVHVCNLAQTFYRENDEEFLQDPTYVGITLKEYMQAYPQQVSLAFVFSIFFRIIHFDIMEVLRVLNIISNILIVIALYKINKQLSKEYKTNKILLLILILTFISLPMLITFIYGDLPSLALCLFSVYFMMKYTETKKIKYPIGASIFTMVAYMMRMNSLIFIIATAIYLLLSFFKEMNKKPWKENLLRISIIAVYIIVSVMPAALVKDYYFSKYELDKNKVYPSISYLLMAMEESPRGNGWYNEEIATPALENPENIKDVYLEKIKDRLTYFSENIGYTFDFYIMKIASMWTENTYTAVLNNNVENISLENVSSALTFYQKALLIVTCLCSLIILIQNRKNLSLNVIFLLTIFVGGFAFHILWEAKSRYIIPYIVVLMPLASISIKELGIKQRLSYILCKNKKELLKEKN